MVYASSAIKDLQYICTKKIKYRKFLKAAPNLRDENVNEEISAEYREYDINGMCSVQNNEDDYREEGIVINSRLSLVLLPEYTKDFYGNVMEKLVPKKRDMVKYINQWFVIRECLPLTNEDDEIIGWDINAAQSGENDY